MDARSVRRVAPARRQRTPPARRQSTPPEDASADDAHALTSLATAAPVADIKQWMECVTRPGGATNQLIVSRLPPAGDLTVPRAAPRRDARGSSESGAGGVHSPSTRTRKAIRRRALSKCLYIALAWLPPRPIGTTGGPLLAAYLPAMREFVSFTRPAHSCLRGQSLVIRAGQRGQRT